jgi:hypothetical protein
MYSFLSIQGFSNFLGVLEISVGLLIASEFHATKPQIYYRHGNVDATYTKLSDFCTEIITKGIGLATKQTVYMVLLVIALCFRGCIASSAFKDSQIFWVPKRCLKNTGCSQHERQCRKKESG